MTTRPDDDGTLAGGDMIARAKSDVKEKKWDERLLGDELYSFATILL